MEQSRYAGFSVVLVEDEKEMDTATPDTMGQLTTTQKEELEELLTKHGDVLDSELGRVSVLKHYINTSVYPPPRPSPLTGLHQWGRHGTERKWMWS